MFLGGPRSWRDRGMPLPGSHVATRMAPPRTGEPNSAGEAGIRVTAEQVHSLFRWALLSGPVFR